jgi:hypothetical protein
MFVLCALYSKYKRKKSGQRSTDKAQRKRVKKSRQIKKLVEALCYKPESRGFDSR